MRTHSSSFSPSATLSAADIRDTETKRTMLYAHVDLLLGEAFEGYDAGPKGNDPYSSKDILSTEQFSTVLIVRSKLFTVVNGVVLGSGDIDDLKETVHAAARVLLPRLASKRI